MPRLGFDCTKAEIYPLWIYLQWITMDVLTMDILTMNLLTMDILTMDIFDCTKAEIDALFDSWDPDGGGSRLKVAL